MKNGSELMVPSLPVWLEIHSQGAVDGLKSAAQSGDRECRLQLHLTSEVNKNFAHLTLPGSQPIRGEMIS